MGNELPTHRAYLPVVYYSVSLQSYLEEHRKRIDRELDRLVPPETEAPATLHRAMRYSLFAGGKRIRPAFCMEAARVVISGRSTGRGPDVEADLLSTSCTLELIHTYSLIHDDLPALDNDDYRRGKPTCHKVFGEAMAILAGDALLTLAFQVLSNLPGTDAAAKSALVAELSRAAGTVKGMIGGQVADLEAVSGEVSPEMLEYIHRSKTAALFVGSVRLGAIAGGASPQQLAAITCFGENAGLAFQIVDDILDVESSTESLGKTAGKDVLQKKVTYPAVHGLERSKQMAADYIQQARTALELFGEHATRLNDLAEFVVSRKA